MQISSHDNIPTFPKSNSIFLFHLLDIIPISISLVIKEDTTDLIVHCGQMWLKRTIHNQLMANVLINLMIGTIFSNVSFCQT